jgi:flavin-dependent dehydrogenase
MGASSFDIVTVGGGLAASSFGKSMAEHGAKVLILEQEKRFGDRIRGEYIVTWGVA